MAYLFRDKFSKSTGKIILVIVFLLSLSQYASSATTTDPAIAVPADGAARSEPAQGSVADPKPIDQSTNTGAVPTSTGVLIPASSGPTEPTPALQETSNNNEDESFPIENRSNNNIFYAISAVLVVGVATFIVSKIFKKSPSKESNNGEEKGCDDIKSLLEAKKREFEEFIKNWPEEKIKEFAKEKAFGEIKKNETAKDILSAAESAKEKYDKLKEAIELLQKRYDLCMLELPSRKNLILIRAKPDDVDILLDIEKSVAGKKTYSPMLEKDEWIEQFNKGSLIYLAKRGEEVLGEISYEKKTEDHAYIDGLVVKPVFQGQGIGREIMRRILEELKDFKRIDLVTHPENAPAIKLYQSLGFVIESQKENYFGDGEPRIVLVLKK